MYSVDYFKFRAVTLVMLVLNSSERWRVDSARFSSFVCKVCSLAFLLLFYSHSLSALAAKDL
jgi:hypothetical protein